MADTPDPRSLVDAAEQAASAGDYAQAEQLLREAAVLQEASLGPLHPDLANTLNNLGVVCEITDKPVDAEDFFRRACGIATAVLEPDHPFVATSRKNLEDFCHARGKAVDSPIPPAPPAIDQSRPAASRGWSRPVAVGTLTVGVLLVMLVGIAVWSSSNDDLRSTPESASAPLPSVPSKPATTAGELVAPPPVIAEKRPSAPSAIRAPAVAAASLCSSLATGSRGSASDWACMPPSLPVGPGPLFFYTRLTSPVDTIVQHRWYRGNRLQQAVELSIRANTSGGYRTYSRKTLGAEDAAEWRVELRTRDDALLHEERFVVR